MAMLEEELMIICKNKHIKWPMMLKIFIDDSFGIIKGNTKVVEGWIYEFNNLSENILRDKWSYRKMMLV